MNRREGEERALTVGLGRQRAGVAVPAAAIASAQPEPLGGAGAVGRVDHLPVAVDQDDVGVARQVLVQRRGDEVVLAQRDHADQRAGEAAVAHQRLDDLDGASQPRLVGDPKQRAPPLPLRVREPGALAERWPRNSDRSGTERTQRPSTASSSTAVL